MVNVDSPNGATVICTFLCEFNSSARCQVRYGTDPTFMNLPYSAVSTESGIAGDSVRVVLREQLNSSTVYYYSVSSIVGDISVTVQGTFATPQYSKYYVSDLTSTMKIFVDVYCSCVKVCPPLKECHPTTFDQMKCTHGAFERHNLSAMFMCYRTTSCYTLPKIITRLLCANAVI